MNNETTITISLVIAVIGCLIGIWSFFNNYKKNVKKDNDALVSIDKSLLKANMKLDDQCSRIQDLQVDIKATGKEIEKIREVQIAHDMEIKAIWRRLDGEE